MQEVHEASRLCHALLRNCVRKGTKRKDSEDYGNKVSVFPFLGDTFQFVVPHHDFHLGVHVLSSGLSNTRHNWDLLFTLCVLLWGTVVMGCAGLNIRCHRGFLGVSGVWIRLM